MTGLFVTVIKCDQKNGVKIKKIKVCYSSWMACNLSCRHTT